ncbi:MAG: CDP-glycerol glycerophosphotransferase family protein [Longibaculum sp.]
MKDYMISIIIDCENSSNENIYKTIKSIEENTKSQNNVEIILMNSSNNVSFIEGDSHIITITGDGIIETLNKAKVLAHGKYVQFLSAGDVFYKQSLDKIYKYISKEKYDFLHCSLLNNHNQYQIEKTYIEDREIEYDSTLFNNLPTKLKGCFIKKELISHVQFLNSAGPLLEMTFFCDFLKEKNVKCLRLSSCIVAYFNDEQFYQTNQQIFDFHLFKRKLTVIEQYYVLMELKKLLDKKSIKERENQFNETEKDNFIKDMQELLESISDKTIINTSALILQHKHYFLSLKHGKDYINEIKIKDVQLNKKTVPYITFRDENLYSVTGVGNFKINILESKNNILTLDGIDVFSFLGDSYKIIAVDNNNHIYEPEVYKWPLLDKKGFIGETIYRGRRFKFQIILNDVKKINFYLINNKNEKFQLIPSFGVYSKLVKRLKMSYYAKDSYIFKYRGKGISISQNRIKTHIKSEVKFLLQLVKNKKFMIIWLRLAYFVFNFFKKKPIWLIRDNEKRAKDSGAEMFKFYSQWDKKTLANAYFILDKKCSDYSTMKKYGKIIQPDSFRYKLYHLLADKLIDTRGGIDCRYIFKEDSDFVKDLCHWDYIWLIHGIMTRNESTWTNKYVLNAKLFATCNVREYQSVLDEMNGYGYDETEVALTGLPRHDALNANKKKKILFLPTWRKHLAGDLIPGTSDRSYVDDFKTNDYYHFYNSLINDERLLKVMREKGYTGDFYLHPSFMKQCNDFVENDVIKVGKEPANTNLLIGECSLLLTDYSSAQFEGAYLDTPVIYTQYDADTFSDNHTGNEGYFVYENDGFGPVCYNLDETVNAIIQYLENDCVNVEPYKTRAKDFFNHHDKKNSQRVFEQILKIDDIHNDNQFYHVESDKENVYLYQGKYIKTIEKIEDKQKIYNSILDLTSYINHIYMLENGFKINATFKINQSYFHLNHFHFEIGTGEFFTPIQFSECYHRKGNDYFKFSVEIPYEKILLCKKSTPIMIRWIDKDGYGYYNNLKCQYLARDDTWASKRNRKLHYSEVKILEDIKTSIFIRETIGNNAYLCIRDINKTDYKNERQKLKRAYWLSRILLFGKARNSVLCFEKFASKYEESASVLFERIIDRGEKNTYFVIDKTSLHYQNIPKQYKKYIIPKYSFKHYLYFFCARAFIATESMNHIIELNISDPNVTMRITKGAYDYIFLQHGVMYMYCLENRSDFIKGQGFTNYSKVVVSSQTEANHFIDYGNFDQEDLIISGLPKFDKSYQNPNADKILIMPTSRDFEYNVIRLTPTESTYYKFTKNIIDAVPEELKEKIVVVGHPLLKQQLHSTDLKKYIPDNYIYDELLRETKLLITDYSSISYDAFYRGCNVIFCWEDKDMCLNAMNYKLMLNESNVFADVSKSFKDLPSLIRQNYYRNQTQEQLDKYRQIVTYHDGNNTERCYEYLLKNGYYGKRKFKSISKCKAKKVTKKVYTGYKRTQTKVELYDGQKTLVKNRDYKIYYLNNKRKTKFAFVIFVGLGHYFGIKIRRFKICQSISSFNVTGISFEDNQLNLDNLAVFNNLSKKYLRKDFHFSTEIIDGPIENSICLVITGKKQFAGKIRILFQMEKR